MLLIKELLTYASIGFQAIFIPKKALFSTRSSCFLTELPQNAFKNSFPGHFQQCFRPLAQLIRA